MIAIQNQSRGVSCASVWPFLCLQGNNMCRLWVKKCNDESEFNWWMLGAIDQPGSRNELGWADLPGSWQPGGHIQSHLTHSALTLDPRQCYPRVNCHLQGSIALDRRHRPLARMLGAMEGQQRPWNRGAGWQTQLTSEGRVTDQWWCGRFILISDLMTGEGHYMGM